MKLPNKVKVACFDIDIEDWHHRTATADGNFGTFSPIELKIRIDTSCNPIMICEVLQHEILHAIYWAYVIDDKDNEERIVSVMATALIQVYRDNPDIMDYIDYLLHSKERGNETA